MARYLALLLPLALWLSGCAQGPQPSEEAATKPIQDSGAVVTLEEEAIKAIEDMGGYVERDHKAPGNPPVKVLFDGTEITEACWKPLSAIKGLKELEFHCVTIKAGGLKGVKQLRNLQSLTIGCMWIADAALEDLDGLKELRALRSLTIWPKEPRNNNLINYVLGRMV